MKHEKQARHRYEVKACRRVRYAGGYYLDSIRFTFAFGAGQPYRTGHLAHEAATAKANSLTPLASDVSIWKMNGYGGVGHYIKNSDERFAHPWSLIQTP